MEERRRWKNKNNTRKRRNVTLERRGNKRKKGKYVNGGKTEELREEK